MLDYTKITFNELDDTDKPVQVFYNYDLKESEIDNFLKEYATTEEVPEGVSIQKIELCLTIYSKHDLKLEACCTDTDNNQYWVVMNEQLSNADELINLFLQQKQVITKEMIKHGFDIGIVSIEEEFAGCISICCRIGDNAFYFIGEEDAGLTKEEYWKSYTLDMTIDMLFNILKNAESAEENGIDEMEWEYYLAVLAGSIIIQEKKKNKE